MGKVKYGFKGKYCSGCNSVWEIPTNSGQEGMLIHYPHFPSYGLERQLCRKCIKIPDTGSSMLSEKIVA